MREYRENVAAKPKRCDHGVWPDLVFGGRETGVDHQVEAPPARSESSGRTARPGRLVSEADLEAGRLLGREGAAGDDEIRNLPARGSVSLVVPSLNLNHAVLFVSNLEEAIRFYTEVLGFAVAAHEDRMNAAFLRAEGSANHHDLGLFQTPAPKPPRGSVGLYHLAWQVDEIEDLATIRDALVAAGSLNGQSHHGATVSLYGADPSGNEFEVMWMLPRDAWGEYEDQGVVMPLDLEAEIERWGAKT